MTHDPKELQAKIDRLELVLKGEPKFNGEFDIVERAIAKAKRRLKEMESKSSSDSTIVDALCSTGLTLSKSEARRAIKQNAVQVNSQLVTNFSASVEDNDEIKLGKKKIVKFVKES